MNRSPVFEETSIRYLAEIGKINYLAKAEMLGAGINGNSLVISLYDQDYAVSADGIVAVSGAEVLAAVQVILSKYVLRCERFEPGGDDPFRTFRDFRDASPLTSYFTTNTNKTLETTFSGRLDALREACRKIGGTEQKSEGYDCSVLFYALPRVPVVLNFNDKDELFPAGSSVLYRASAEQFLDMECLAMTGTLLAGKLIRSSSVQADMAALTLYWPCRSCRI